jgi:hypothetical protein
MNVENGLFSILAMKVPILWKTNINNSLYESSSTINFTQNKDFSFVIVMVMPQPVANDIFSTKIINVDLIASLTSICALLVPRISIPDE